MLPLVPALFTAGAGLNALYGVGNAVDSYRYWTDYYKNTGYFPRYPFRSGAVDWAADLGHTAYTSAYWFRY